MSGKLTDRQTPFQIGTAGWSYPDWEGVFYPSPAPRRFRALAYYSRFFNLVEVNATFYAVFPPSHAEKWCQEVAGRPDFTFSLKLWKGLTHESPSPLPRVEIRSIRDTCSVLSGHGRLGALLMQFPWSFRFSPANFDRLKKLLDAFEGFPRAVEIRHASWHTAAFFDVLRERAAAFCNIDQPLLRDCPPPTSLSTASFSYLRIHGRNAPNWFRESATGGERYDYYYPPAEVEELARLARALADQTSRVMVTTNNHYRGQAPADALLLRAALEGKVDRVPSCLARAFPDVRALPARHAPEPEDALQPDLFDLPYEKT